MRMSVIGALAALIAWGSIAPAATRKRVSVRRRSITTGSPFKRVETARCGTGQGP